MRQKKFNKLTTLSFVEWAEEVIRIVKYANRWESVRVEFRRNYQPNKEWKFVVWEFNLSRNVDELLSELWEKLPPALDDGFALYLLFGNLRMAFLSSSTNRNVLDGSAHLLPALIDRCIFSEVNFFSGIHGFEKSLWRLVAKNHPNLKDIYSGPIYSPQFPNRALRALRLNPYILGMRVTAGPNFDERMAERNREFGIIAETAKEKAIHLGLAFLPDLPPYVILEMVYMSMALEMVEVERKEQVYIGLYKHLERIRRDVDERSLVWILRYLQQRPKTTNSSFLDALFLPVCLSVFLYIFLR